MQVSVIAEAATEQPAAQVAFLRYKLPAIACQPPLLLCLSLAAPRAVPGQPQQLLLLVQFALSPVLSAPFRQATLDLDVPASLGQPQQVRRQCVACVSAWLVSGFKLTQADLQYASFVWQSSRLACEGAKL